MDVETDRYLHSIFGVAEMVAEAGQFRRVSVLIQRIVKQTGEEADLRAAKRI